MISHVQVFDTEEDLEGLNKAESGFPGTGEWGRRFGA